MLAEALIRCACCAWCTVSFRLLGSLAWIYGCGTGPSQVQMVLDFVYFRSKALQSCFNYHMNYLQYTNGDDGVDELDHGTTRAGSEQCGTIKRCVRIASQAIHSKVHGVAVLFHGLFSSPGIFTCGDNSSLASYLQQAGYEVWTLDSKYDEVLDTVRLLEIARHVLQHSENGASVTWIAHSTACEPLLGALSVANGAASHQMEQVDQLRSVTASAVLLSPVVVCGHDEDGILTGNQCLAQNLLKATPWVDPQTVHDLLRNEGQLALRSLRLWRDLLTPTTYCSYIIAPLARLVLGWEFRNISRARRTNLLHTLFQDTPTAMALRLFELAGGARRRQRRRSGIVDALTWCASTTGNLVKRVFHRSVMAEQNTQSIQLPCARPPARLLVPCRVTAVVGGSDGLVDAGNLERALSQCDAVVHVIPGYEHMDTLWADGAVEKVFCVIGQ
jgi:pimeloyl-ACP methyl ester carboxylesterase